MQKFNLEWKKGMSFKGVTPSNHKIVLDASEEVGGKNSGPRPMELFIIGLMGCTSMDVISILNKMRKNIKSFRVSRKSRRTSKNLDRYKFKICFER